MVILSAVVGGWLVAGCGGSGSGSKAADGSSDSAVSAAASAETPTTFAAALVGTGNVFFLSPSKNIGCALSETAVRCDIRERAWAPPPRPASCESDYGEGVTLVATSPASLTCAGDSVLVGEKVLEYGSAVTRGDFECRSEPAGMRCRNAKSGHEFSLSREKYTLS